MIPFRDNIPSRSFPTITVSIIIANVLVFFYELSLGSRSFERFIMQYGVVPTTVLAWPESHVPFTAVALPFFTSIFLHGGWLHLIANMWYLWIFGDNVEDRLGPVRYLAFYLIGGIVASIAHYATAPASRVPMVGASGAIAAVLGAYAITFPRARVITLIPFFPFVQIVALPALAVLGLWFVFQFFSGALSLAWSARGGVAWWAHIGGFVFGMLAMRVL